MRRCWQAPVRPALAPIGLPLQFGTMAGGAVLGIELLASRPGRRVNSLDGTVLAARRQQPSTTEAGNQPCHSCGKERSTAECPHWLAAP